MWTLFNPQRTANPPMRIQNILWEGRRAWSVASDRLRFIVLAGGGHIASVTHAERPGVNPLWTPPWPGMEPWHYREKQHAAAYGGLRLLAALRGHNLCLGWFGDAAASEKASGLGPHGEAPVARWRLLDAREGVRTLRLRLGCSMERSGLACERTLAVAKGSDTVAIRDRVINLLGRELPYTLAQHVTIGPPFLQPGVTRIDCSATRGHSFPGKFEDRPRFAADRAFDWPDVPAANGKGTVDLRGMENRPGGNSDFAALLMDPAREDAFFRVTHPGQGLSLAYHWKRADFPWLGNWEENRGRTAAPWKGRTLCRGLEFSNTPFPISLRDSVERGELFGVPTFEWLPAKARRDYIYKLTLSPLGD